MQLSPIFFKHKLILPHANDRKISIVYNSQGSLNVQYCPSMPVRELDTNREICRVDSILEFTLKFQNSKVEYGNGKVKLIIPEELKAYRESLLDNINEYFTDYDNDGFIRLHVAAQKGDVDLGRHLLECGANIEIKSKTKVGGDTALHLAARNLLLPTSIKLMSESPSFC